MSISSNKVVQKPGIVVDHNFAIPPTVVDVRHENENDLIGQIDEEAAAGSENQDQSSTVEYVVVPVDEILEDNASSGAPETGGTALPTPTSMSIVEQIYSVAEDGTALVDVIIETPDMAGVTQIDVRVARA